MRRAWLLALALAGCGGDEEKAGPPPFPIEGSVTVADVKAAGFESAARVRFAPGEFGEFAYVIERGDGVAREGREETIYHTIGRVRMRPGFDVDESRARHRRLREQLAQEAASDAPGVRTLRDRSAPGVEPFIYTEDSPAANEAMERQRLATIGFLWDRYAVSVSANGGASDTIEDLSRRAGKLARWVETQFEQHPRPPR